MYKLPINFDINEWFVVITLTCLIIIFIIVPNTMPKGLTLTIFLYFAVLGLTADVLIGVDYPFDFYDIMDSPKLELFDVIIYSVNYSLYGYFFSYFLFKQKNLGRILLFIIFWAGISTIIEWVSVRFNVFTYMNGWNTGFSAIVYLFVFTTSAIVVKWLNHCWEE
ncbi:hypothetical protein SAMN05216389_107126 [Oceanobacillus limi]|uniref:Uncharacterized protein n=1 Tax=Oceanobacillus limi TaxID=930131 RepID=A0A1I0CXR1_9BACI|nr:hypothetical protein [Oceanobacillus limi]SET24385.1 hypothetical protein SAMN05216389_107126 [Oceanobacillus limi]